MIQKILFLLILSVLFESAMFSQKPIEVSYEKDKNGDYTFTAINHNFCAYTLEINFSELINLRATTSLPYKDIIVPGRNYLFKLLRISKGVTPSFRYKVKYLKGCFNAKVNREFIYLLPVASGKESKVFKINYLGSTYFGEQEPKDWYCIGFKVQTGDTIFASRKGVVVMIRDTTILKGTDFSFAKSDNFIEIYHSDCSFGEYGVIREGGSLVKVGDMIEAGQPIGIAAGDKYTTGSHIRFKVYYQFVEEARKIDGTETDRINKWAFVPLIFHTKDNKDGKLIFDSTYISEHPDSLITLEMSKREIKKWKNTKK